MLLLRCLRFRRGVGAIGVELCSHLPRLMRIRRLILCLELLVVVAAVLRSVGRQRCLFARRGVAVLHQMLHQRCRLRSLLQLVVDAGLLTTSLARMGRLAQRGVHGI